MTAAVNTVPVAKILDSFLAIEKNELNLFCEARLPSQHSRQFQKQAGARSAVIRADKAKRIENFRVVVRTEQKPIIGFPSFPKTRDQIYETNLTARGIICERLLAHAPT
jgi:hypothetical protein